MGYCPKKAVEAGHSLAILQYYLITTLVTAKLISWLTTSTGFSIAVNNYWLKTLLESVYYIPALFLSYWIFWVLIRIPAVNAIFSVTTLTYYYKRFHEPGTRIKDLINRKTVSGKANSDEIENRAVE